VRDFTVTCELRSDGSPVLYVWETSLTRNDRWAEEPVKESEAVGYQGIAQVDHGRSKYFAVGRYWDGTFEPKVVYQYGAIPVEKL
jgi:hypothetical protein